MKNRGFTIIELLVSISIIFVLMAMLMAVVPAAKRKAQQAPCTSNLRQIYMAYDMYCQDNDGWNFPVREIESIQTYVSNKSIFSCPAEDFIVQDYNRKYPAAIGRYWDLPEQRKIDFKFSYLYMPDYEPGDNPEFWRAMQTKAGVGFMACIWHGRIHRRAPGAANLLTPMMDGPILRLCFDGHVKIIPPESRPGFVTTIRMFYSPFLPIPVPGPNGEWGITQ